MKWRKVNQSKEFIKKRSKDIRNEVSPKFHIKLDPEYEAQIFSRFLEIADQATNEAVEHRSIPKQYLTKKEFMEERRIRHVVMNELCESGLKFYKIR